MIDFIKKHQISIASILLVIFSLHLSLTADKRETGRRSLIKDVIHAAAAPVERLAIGTYSTAVGAVSGYVLLVNVNKENSALKDALTALMEENNRMREKVLEAGRLKEILDFKEATPFKTTAAAVVALSADMWGASAVINKGASHGIIKDMAVISRSGAAGRVIEAGMNSSTVLLSTDLRSAIDVISQRGRIKGIAEGNGSGGMILKYVRQFDDVQVGDLVVTSGLTGIFPKGLPVGEVVKIEKGRDNFFRLIELKPAVDMKRLEEVLVVTDPGFIPGG
ncbi:MAG: rod shape-determining protein MreC [Deltaproteobacteria bacterium]|nr:rod shape-determining protein MreC [Deltaproteobacteria bacterium]